MKKVCIFCVATVKKKCAAASEYIFLCFSKYVAASRCISMFLKEINERLLLKEKNVLLRNYVRLRNILNSKTD